MADREVIEGCCFCGAIGVRVVGKPAAMGYCHCTSCRAWSASPVTAFTLWPPGRRPRHPRGANQLDEYSKTDNSIRRWCKTCGGHVLTEHPRFELTDVYAGVIPDFPFDAMLHVNYGETVLPMRDGLPKQNDFPKEMGGTGRSVPRSGAARRAARFDESFGARSQVVAGIGVEQS